MLPGACSNLVVYYYFNKNDFQMRYGVFLMYNTTCGFRKSTTLDFPVNIMWKQNINAHEHRKIQGKSVQSNIILNVTM